MTKAGPDKSEKTGGLFNEGRLSRMRLVSGLILFVYVFFHLLNHALGLISLEVMDQAISVQKAIWRFPPMSIVLYGALVVHVVSALIRVYRRRSMIMPVREWMQLALGIAIPFLLLVHVMGTRYAAQRYGINDTYAYVLLSTFVFSPVSGWLNAAGLVAVWFHGCVGIQMWANLKPWYTPRFSQAGMILAVLVPTLSLCGYLMAGRTISPFARDGDFMAAYYETLNLSSDQVWLWLSNDIDTVRWILIVVLVLLFAARLIKNMISSRDRKITIDYVDGPAIQQPTGLSLLEVSNLANVPHASVCGGRGRCSTCRIRILTPDPPIDPPSESEIKVLSRIRADPDVRLACQVFPRGSLQVMRLLPSDGTVANSASQEPWASGREKTVTVMFVDIREFTRTSESRLPFDVVYLINQFSQSMGIAVENHAGRIDKFLGDGFMALFGVEGSPEQSARQAIEASREMIEELAKLNTRLAGDLSEPLRMGVGVHTGSVILGAMGYGSARGLTAIGDTVNTASRLETATKEQGCVLCISADTIGYAGVVAPKSSRRHIKVRGKRDEFEIAALDGTEAFPSL